MVDTNDDSCYCREEHRPKDAPHDSCAAKQGFTSTVELGCAVGQTTLVQCNNQLAMSKDRDNGADFGHGVPIDGDRTPAERPMRLSCRFETRQRSVLSKFARFNKIPRCTLAHLIFEGRPSP